MVISQTEEPKIHWNYFLALESDCQNLSRYIEFTEDNFKTYSIELAHLLFAAASEVDVLTYQKEIIPAYPKIKEIAVTIPRHALKFRPWENWEAEESPYWWRAYNNVKHERNTHFKEANLQHALNALGGLLILLLYFYKGLSMHGELSPPPSFMQLDEKHIKAYGSSGVNPTIWYIL